VKINKQATRNRRGIKKFGRNSFINIALGTCSFIE